METISWERVVELDDGKTAELKYYLCETATERGALFGAKVEKRLDGAEETDTVYVTHEREAALELLAKLAQGGVTPFGLREAIDEM